VDELAELAELNVVKLRTLCGLDFILEIVIDLRKDCFSWFSETLTSTAVSCFRAIMVRGGLGGKEMLAGFELLSTLPSLTPSFPVLRLGDGDREDEIQDFLAKVANDSDADFVLSRGGLDIWGTGGISLDDPSVASDESSLSGEPFTLCIHDLGRATKDFLLRTLSSFGRSSLGRRLPVFPSLPSFALSFLLGEIAREVCAEIT
jgi:hypothetical protein